VALPEASFVVNGAAPPHDLGLMAAGAELLAFQSAFETISTACARWHATTVSSRLGNGT